MKIYFAGLPAGHLGFVSWEKTEKDLYRVGLRNRLVSFFFKDSVNGILKFKRCLCVGSLQDEI